MVLGAAGLTGLLDVTAGASTVVIGAANVSWWVPILVVSIVAAAFAYVAGVAAVRMLGAKVSSFVALTEVLFAIAFAWLVLDELPMPVQLLGGLLIVGGLVAVRADESRTGAVVPSEFRTDTVPVDEQALDAEPAQRQTGDMAQPTT